ncbi:MAG TPA: hypothetical protein VEP49_16410, partial [Acidimicrobiia bacterium]|nr:hypothetical protein [Acidimicrobiia bacterium]
AWAVVNWLGVDRIPVARYACVGVLLLVTAFGFAARAREVIDRRHTFGAPETDAQRLVDQLESRPLPRKPVLVRGLGTSTNGLAQGLVDELDRRGVPVRVDKQYGFQYGDQRTADRAHVAQIWYVTGEGRWRSLLPRDSGARVLGYVSGLSAREDRELTSLQRAVAAQLRAAGRPDLVDDLDSAFLRIVVEKDRVRGVSLSDAQRISDFNEKLARDGSCRCTVIAYPAATAPELPYSMGF